MTLDDLKDQLAGSFRQVSERVQETELFINLKDRFDAQNPFTQKMIVAGSITLVFALVLLLPWSWYSSSEDVVASFDTRRGLIRELLKVAREAADVPNIPMPPSTDMLKGDIESRLKQSNLVQEQIKSIDVASTADSKLITAERSSGGLSVSLWKLNVRQIVDVGAALSSLNPSVKMVGLDVKANPEDAHYFDVVFKLASLNVPDLSTPPPPLEEEPQPKKKAPTKKKGAGDE